MLDDLAAGLLLPLPFLVGGKAIQSEVERVLDVFLESGGHVSGLRSSPCLPELAHEHGSVDSRLLSKLSQNRLLGGLPFVDAAAGHLRSGVDIDVVEDQQPAAGIGHVGHGSLIAVRMPARHRRQLLCTADSLTAVLLHALILPYPPRLVDLVDEAVAESGGVPGRVIGEDVAGGSCGGRRVGWCGQVHVSRAALGERTGLPVVHLDRHFWRPGWVETPRDEWRRRQAELFAGDRWIADGNYGGTFDERFSRADTVIVFALPRLTCLAGALKRSTLNHGRAIQADGCPERFQLSFFRGSGTTNATAVLDSTQPSRATVTSTS